MSGSFATSICSSRASRVSPFAVQRDAASAVGRSVTTTMATSSTPRPTITGSGTPTGMRSMLARTFSCTRRMAESEFTPTLKRAVTSAPSSSVCEYTCSTPSMLLTMVSSGSVTSLTASSALSPFALTRMSTIGTEICGSSSRGRPTSATSPSAIEARRKSGVSADLMKMRVRLPAMPSFMASESDRHREGP